MKTQATKRNRSRITTPRSTITTKPFKSQPNNTEYKLRADRARFEAGQWHVDQGARLQGSRQSGTGAGGIPQGAMIDPSSAVAEQEVQSHDGVDHRQGRSTTQNAAPPVDGLGRTQAHGRAAQLQPLSRAPINMKATNDSKAVFDAIGKLAGLTVIFDPDFTSRRISVELTDVTLEQALNITALREQGFLASGDLQYYFRGSRPAAKAQGL